MSIGQRLRQARMEAGLTQRQVCGTEITRNMLSLIENGTASPSVATLTYLAKQLDKPVSYFLEEAAASPNTELMEEARHAFDASDAAGCAECLKQFRLPDPVYQREWELLRCLTAQAMAAQAIEHGRSIYAQQLLEETDSLEAGLTWFPELRHRRARLLSRLRSSVPAELLPDLDEDLCLRARLALQSDRNQRAAELLDAAENRQTPEWSLLRGKAALRLGRYEQAAALLQRAEQAYPQEAVPALETAYRELEDFKMAYHYACLGRK